MEVRERVRRRSIADRHRHRIFPRTAEDVRRAAEGLHGHPVVASPGVNVRGRRGVRRGHRALDGQGVLAEAQFQVQYLNMNVGQRLEPQPLNLGAGERPRGAVRGVGRAVHRQGVTAAPAVDLDRRARAVDREYVVSSPAGDRRGDLRVLHVEAVVPRAQLDGDGLGVELDVPGGVAGQVAVVVHPQAAQLVDRRGRQGEELARGLVTVVHVAV